jgi:hypothetical protein
MPARFRLRTFFLGCMASLGSPLSLCAKPILPQVIFGRAPMAVDATDLEAICGEPQFDTLATPLPPNVASLGYHITATSEFGDLVRLAGAGHFIDSVTITMSSWAIRSDYPSYSPLGFTHVITLKLYEVDRGSGQPRVGRMLAAVPTPFLIPWRPEPDPAAPPSELRPWRAADGNYYGGLAFNLTFDLGALSIALPDEMIVSISFNTQYHGEAPLGVEGPYNSLNVGVSSAPPAVGTDLAAGAVYWKTADGTFYSDAGSAGVNELRLDTGWAAYTPALRFNNSPFGTLADVATRVMDMNGSNALSATALKEARALITSALERTLWENKRQPRTAWGQLVFNLLAETADQLSTIAASRDVLAPQAAQAIDSLVTVARSIAESALGDAIIVSGDPTSVAKAQDALDAAAQMQAAARADLMIDELGTAWREAQAAVR